MGLFLKIGGPILIALAGIVLFLMQKMGVFVSVESINSKGCKALHFDNLVNIEDIALSSSHIYMAADPYRSEFVNADAFKKTFPLATSGNMDKVDGEPFDASNMLHRYIALDKLVTKDKSQGRFFISRGYLNPEQFPTTSAITTSSIDLQELVIRNWDFDTHPDFHPLGIDVFTPSTSDNLQYLPSILHAVVNTRYGPEVAIFGVRDTGKDISLNLHVSARHPLFVTSNDVTTIGPGVFLTTNLLSTGADKPLGQLYEILTSARKGSLIRCVTNRNVFENPLYAKYNSTNTSDLSHPFSCHPVVENLAQPNGVLYDAANQFVYLAQTSDWSVTKYNVINANTSDASIDPSSAQVVLLEASPDNLSLDSKGRVIVTTIPRSVDFGRLMSKELTTAPNQVFRVSFGAKGTSPTVETVYSDFAPEIGGITTTVATIDGKFFVSSSAFSPGLLVCKLQV